MDNVINLSDRSDKGVHWSVEDAIDQLKASIQDDQKYNKKAFFILLDNEDPDNYDMRTLSAGFERTSEVIALLEIQISLLKREMGF